MAPPNDVNDQGDGQRGGMMKDRSCVIMEEEESREPGRENGNKENCQETEDVVRRLATVTMRDDNEAKPRQEGEPSGSGSAESVPFDDLLRAGPPASPIRFPPPSYLPARRVEQVLYYDKATQKHEVAKDVLIVDDETFHDDDDDCSEDSQRRRRPKQRAYWRIPDKQPILTNMGRIDTCIVLEICPKSEDSDSDNSDDSMDFDNDDEEEEDIVFELTNRYVAIKVTSSEMIKRNMRDRHCPDNPLSEIASMQLCGVGHANVLGCLEVLYDGRSVNIVMPYCDGGDVFALVEQTVNAARNESNNIHGLEERGALRLFRQMIEGQAHLQRMGICHRDLSPENVMLDSQGNALIIDFGMSLWVPFNAPEQQLKQHVQQNQNQIPCQTPANVPPVDSVRRAAHPKRRRLMTPQGCCGKLRYMAPETFQDQVFDGYAIDVWTLGTILFFMLTGTSYRRPEPCDQVFQCMTTNLAGLFRAWNINVSTDAVDLLQRLLQVDVRRRLTLDEIREHPWITQGCPRTF